MQVDHESSHGCDMSFVYIGKQSMSGLTDGETMIHGMDRHA